MTETSQGAGSGPDSSTQAEFKEYVVSRDSEGPYSFAGVQLAKASRESGGVLGGDVVVLEAAVYKTRGGKFITSLSKKTRPSGVMRLSALMSVGTDDEDHDGTSAYRKAAVHGSFEDAVLWFKPGRLTDEIRKQLGLDKPVRIE